MVRAPLALRLRRDTRGGVTIIGALSLTGVVGITGLAMEISQGYAVKVSNQRVADAAALAAALAYSAGSNAAVVLPTAQGIAQANGLPATSVAAPAPTAESDGRQLITVSVTTQVPLRLTQMLTSQVRYAVSATGVAAVGSTTSSTTTSATPGCILALSTTATTGVYMNGGTRFTGTGCAVNANKPVSVVEGAGLTATQVNSGGTITTNGGAFITTTPTANNRMENKPNAAVDPLANNTALSAALAKTTNAANFAPPAALADPTTPGANDWTFSYSPSSSVSAYRTSQYGGDFVVPAGTYRIGRLTIAGGVNVTFQGVSNVTVRGGFKNEGNRLNIGNGSDWKVNGGFDTGSGGVAFGDSSVTIGSGTTTLNNFTIGNGSLVINGTPTFGYGTLAIGAGTHRFAGFTLSGGQTLSLGAGEFSSGRIYVGGGSRLTIGAGAKTIGASNGNSIYVEGGSSLTFADGTFVTSGGITTGGGTTIAFGSTANHYVNGHLDLSGAATFGAGAYTVNGNFTNMTGCGGCSMTGTDVSFFLSGTVTLGGGSGLNVRAPAANTGEALADILFATRTTAATRLTQGASNMLVGIWWAPNSPFLMDGGAGIGSAGRCFMLIASTVTLNGGTAAATTCAAAGSSTQTTTVTVPTVNLIR